LSIQTPVAGPNAVERAVATLKKHPKQLTALVASLMLGAAGGAYALASLAPDPTLLPVRQVVETVALPELAASGIEPILNLYRSDITQSKDSADTLLKRLGVDDPAAAAFLRKDPLVRQEVLKKAGRSVTAETRQDHSLNKLQVRWSTDDSTQFSRLVVEKTGADFNARIETAPLEVTQQMASGTINTSLFAATDDAGLPDSLAVQMAEIFSGDIDFRRALRKGDRFSLVYEAYQADGETLRTGRVLSAEFVNKGKSFQAMWFQPPGESAKKGAYYDLEGNSLHRAFLSSPVRFSRISSGFAMRFHPILKEWRRHLGTDFAAPTGTPARTVGDGVVEFAGRQNGYGNMVIMRHSGNIETVYAHLSKISVRRGQRVDQGETVGLVGSTGWATGPHLHFEIRVNGVQKDPMAMAQRSQTIPVPASAKAQFKQQAALARSELQAAASIHQTQFE
jgi:murein DD-endopeptidase MepM/ murein hydrolase activator NlpD